MIKSINERAYQSRQSIICLMLVSMLMLGIIFNQSPLAAQAISDETSTESKNLRGFIEPQAATEKQQDSQSRDLELPENSGPSSSNKSKIRALQPASSLSRYMLESDERAELFHAPEEAPIPSPSLGQALLFPLQWPLGVLAATSRGSWQELSRENSTTARDTGSKALTAPAVLFFAPMSLLAGFLRAPVLAGQNAMSEPPLTKKALSLSGRLDISDEPDSEL